MRVFVMADAGSGDGLGRFLSLNAGPVPGIVPEPFVLDGATHARSACLSGGLIADSNLYGPDALAETVRHITLWRRCAAGSEPFHVAAPGILLRFDFASAASAALASVPGWDVVLWMHNLDWPAMVRMPGWGDTVLNGRSGGLVRNDALRRASGSAPFLLPLVSAAGLGCYSVSPGGAARMLSDCVPVGAESALYAADGRRIWGNHGLDVEMSRHYHAWNAHLAVPPLAAASVGQ